MMLTIWITIFIGEALASNRQHIYEFKNNLGIFYEEGVKLKILNQPI